MLLDYGGDGFKAEAAAVKFLASFRWCWHLQNKALGFLAGAVCKKVGGDLVGEVAGGHTRFILIWPVARSLRSWKVTSLSLRRRTWRTWRPARSRAKRTRRPSTVIQMPRRF